MWSFLPWKQGRYYVETNYLEDVLALGSFFHYAQGYRQIESFDLTLPELNPVGKIKDLFFPQPRMDFYALVQAKKSKSSPHGTNRPDGEKPPIGKPEERGLEFKPRVLENDDGIEMPSPYY